MADGAWHRGNIVPVKIVGYLSQLSNSVENIVRVLRAIS